MSRACVANLISLALRDGVDTLYKIVDLHRPTTIGFRLNEKFILRELDCPLNEGGPLGMVRGGINAEARRLDLDPIAESLSVMAEYYPRPFADFLNDASDDLTADVFLQRCLLGELVDG